MAEPYKFDDEYDEDHVFDDPFRLRILKSLTAALQGISPINGYDHDLSGDGEAGSNLGQVCRGRIEFGDEEPLPLVSILEPPIPLDVILSRGDNPNSSGDWQLLIQGFVEDDPRNPSDPAHRLMAEVKTRLVEEKRRDRGDNQLHMRGKVIDMDIGQGSVRPADATSEKCFFWLILTLKIVESLDNPYA